MRAPSAAHFPYPLLPHYFFLQEGSGLVSEGASKEAHAKCFAEMGEEGADMVGDEDCIASVTDAPNGLDVLGCECEVGVSALLEVAVSEGLGEEGGTR